MPRCDCHSVMWKGRRAFRLANGAIELKVLLGGGHIADFRLLGSPINILWEPPWNTIDPNNFSTVEHAALYGEESVGKFLSGYTGHALVLGYFGMPSREDAAQGLSLHGEAAVAEWNVISMSSDQHSASLSLEVELPVYRLHFRRKITLATNASTAAIDETILNLSGSEVAFQWVQHASFGEPFYTRSDSSLFVPVSRAVTWPFGYEGREFLAKNAEFVWPNAPTANGGRVDLSTPFQRDMTGLVASLLTPAERSHAYVAIHNRRYQLAAGYSFDRSHFPWIALWEENRARSLPPWNGITRVRGVEFGTSPMPLGLEQAREAKKLYGTPVLATIAPHSQRTTAYEMFVSQVPPVWKGISDVVPSRHGLMLREQANEIQLNSSRSLTRH
jgi:Domain of unknown function (DUF4432)